VTKDAVVIKAVSVPKQRIKKHLRFAPAVGAERRMLIAADHVRQPLQWVSKCGPPRTKFRPETFPSHPPCDRLHSP